MDLYKEILIKLLEKEPLSVAFTNLTLSAAEMVELKCCNALQKIKAVIENDSLDDFECVEEIVRVFEDIGSSGGTRHDFG